MSVDYISVEQLTSIYNQDDSDSDNDYEFKLKEVVIIDVRDDDYVGGNIKGARNIPSLTWNINTPLSLVNELCNNKIKLVIFYCMMSQVRGPKAARKFNDCLIEFNSDSDKPQVKILKYGFQGWLDHHSKSYHLSCYISNYNSDANENY